ncbi:hypothetical protein BSL78_26008 [Apostichopus japonicus]|uniref:Integrase core domain-containing protein n=1 Tax=Stichopus japonicus TaxID=307972 RepID=A0A2G8JN12_STIJA|nr:hypothetical protein BSL78_26008 [Apostichopus japonicus]
MPAPLEYTAADLGAIGRGLRMPLIEHYFMQGFQGQEIVALLGLCHNISISLRHLKRLLQQLNLRRRRQESPVEDIAQVILRELEGSGRNIGYRLMWHRLNYIYGLRVTQDTTRRMLNIIDPDGVSRRSAHRLQRRVYMCPGPNHTIHIDGYDKLKPFGIAIHGAVDGFSRRLLWLKAGHSNNNPRLVAKYYIDFIRRSQGVPKIVRADRGTENTIVHRLQVALRWHHEDGRAKENSFLYGRSTANQRIECMWSQLRRMSMNYWINLFKICVTKVYLITATRYKWNVYGFALSHSFKRIWTALLFNGISTVSDSKDKMSVLSGKPDLMYYIPEAFEATDHKMSLDYSNEDLTQFEREYCETLPRYGCHDFFANALTELVGDLDQFEMPENVTEAIGLYVALNEIFEELEV